MAIKKNECNRANTELPKCTLTAKISGKGNTDPFLAHFLIITLEGNLILLGILPFPYILVIIYLETDFFQVLKDLY